MHWIVMLAALLVAFQPQPKITEQPSAADQALEAFNLYRELDNANAAVADDHIADGSALLFYRSALFVHIHGKATPAEAIKAAAAVVHVPEAMTLGARLNVRPLEVEKRGGATAAADREWLVGRTVALMLRKDLGAVGQLITDTNLPLPGRVRLDILSDKDRDEQLEIRYTVLVTALQSFRESSANPVKLSDEDSEAASMLAREQIDRDYMRINGYFVRVRGHAVACALLDADAVAKTLVGWVGPALMELEGVKNLTLAPVESGWVVVDADTGWSLKDPTIGTFTARDVLMLQKGLHSDGK